MTLEELSTGPGPKKLLAEQLCSKAQQSTTRNGKQLQSLALAQASWTSPTPHSGFVTGFGAQWPSGVTNNPGANGAALPHTSEGHRDYWRGMVLKSTVPHRGGRGCIVLEDSHNNTAEPSRHLGLWIQHGEGYGLSVLT